MPLREITVQHFDHTASQIVRSQRDIHLVLDVSNLRPPPDSILHEMQIKFQSAVTLKEYELIGARQIISKGQTTVLDVATTT
ncbi:MAG: hypothetical protein ACREUT_08525 [Steroidobacteraceae bacterium]